jgi:hypothetical protein
MVRITATLFLLILIVSCGESNMQKPTSDDLVQIENDWMQAMMKRDKPVLDELVAPEFTVSGINYLDSAAVTRSVWMNNILQDMKIDSVHFINIKANKIDNVGIVRAQFYWSGIYGEDRFSDSTSFVDTWIKRGGGWRVVSRIITD